ncbi:MAG TPA: hypothetical protein VHE53_03985 [Patescibacteria group bacterium]|nr:hypothetical protein [Patescibacteria group bacterium]
MAKRITITKPTRKKPKLSGSQEFIILLPFILIVGVILAAVAFWISGSILFWNESHPKLPASLTLKQYNTQSYPINEWNTYTNNKYGFSIKYPKYGYIRDNSCFTSGKCTNVYLGTCGSDIKVSPWTKSSTFISLDNMLGIIINSYSGPIDRFIVSQGGDPKNFEIRKAGKNGDINYVTLKTNNDPNWTPPVPSITTPSYIIQKNGYVYQFAPLQNPGSKTGCLPPAGNNGNVFVPGGSWNIPNSISFD